MKQKYKCLLNVKVVWCSDLDEHGRQRNTVQATVRLRNILFQNNTTTLWRLNLFFNWWEDET